MFQAGAFTNLPGETQGHGAPRLGGFETHDPWLADQGKALHQGMYISITHFVIFLMVPFFGWVRVRYPLARFHRPLPLGCLCYFLCYSPQGVASNKRMDNDSRCGVAFIWPGWLLPCCSFLSISLLATARRLCCSAQIMLCVSNEQEPIRSAVNCRPVFCDKQAGKMIVWRYFMFHCTNEIIYFPAFSTLHMLKCD